ncbi:MAG TPA: hypothetical protein VKT28_18075 [Puia sp.]|nr:hypothetical protein [Puia sp.]
MKRYKTGLLLLLVSTAFRLHAQDSLALLPTNDFDAPLDKVSAGAGVGYEYGGIGVNAIYYPLRNVGVFGGVGWQYVGVGYNGGVKVRAFVQAPSVLIIPYVEFMYGTNTFVYYRDNPGYNKLFKNFTFGGGIDIRPGNSKLGFISLALYVPLRTPDIKNYTNDYIDHFYGVTPTNKLYWLNASIGYKFILWK